jgi:hypothetical protein
MLIHSAANFATLTGHKYNIGSHFEREPRFWGTVLICFYEEHNICPSVRPRILMLNSETVQWVFFRLMHGVTYTAKVIARMTFVLVLGNTVPDIGPYESV